MEYPSFFPETTLALLLALGHVALGRGAGREHVGSERGQPRCAGIAEVTFAVTAAGLDAEQFLDPAAQCPCELESDGGSGGVLVRFHGGHRLACDTGQIGELLLRQTKGLALLAQSIFIFRRVL